MLDKVISYSEFDLTNYYKNRIVAIKTAYTNSIINNSSILRPSAMHRELVFFIARNILQKLLAPTDRILDVFFSGSYTRGTNIFGSDYDIDWIYPEKYRDIYFPIEVEFHNTFQRILGIKKRNSIHAAIVGRAGHSSFAKINNKFDHYIIYRNLSKILYDLMPYLQNITQNLNCNTIQRLLNNVNPIIFSMLLKWSKRDPDVCAKYLKAHIGNSWSIMGTSITNSGLIENILNNNFNAYTKHDKQIIAVYKNNLRTIKNIFHNKKFLKSTDYRTIKYYLRNDGFRHSMEILFILAMLTESQVYPLKYESYKSNLQIRSVIGKYLAENYFNLIEKLMKIMTAINLYLADEFDHKAESWVSFLGDTHIERIGARFHYPFNERESFKKHLEELHLELMAYNIIIIKKIEGLIDTHL